MRGKFGFLYVDIWFDETKCKFIEKNCSLICWLCFRLFLWLKKNNFSLQFPSSFNSRGVFRTQSNIYHWGFFAKIIKGFQTLTIFTKNLNRKFLTGFEIRFWSVKALDVLKTSNDTVKLTAIDNWYWQLFLLPIFPNCFFMLTIFFKQLKHRFFIGSLTTPLQEYYYCNKIIFGTQSYLLRSSMVYAQHHE